MAAKKSKRKTPATSYFDRLLLPTRAPKKKRKTNPKPREWKASINGREFRVIAPTLRAARREALSVYREALGGGRRKVKMSRANPAGPKTVQAWRGLGAKAGRSGEYKTATDAWWIIGIPVGQEGGGTYAQRTARYASWRKAFTAGFDKAAKANPAGLPIGRTVTVKAKRRRDGRVDLYRA